MTDALSGITILEIGGMGPTSIAAQMLADMGAEVIKISSPPGAAARGVGAGKSFVEGLEGLALFDTLRNKKNIGINLKGDRGKRVIRELTAKADVVIEAFRPGVMDRLGLGYETLAEINPRIILCSVSGYGQNGPYRDLPGHDANYAAMGGMMGLVGRSADEPPVMVENALADMSTAVFMAALGILGAICARERTGRGQWIDIALTDGVTFLLNGVPEVAEYLFGGRVPRRGSTLFGGSQPCYNVYPTADGKYITLGTLEPHFWRAFCRAIGREDLIPLQYPQGPKKAELFEELERIFRTRTRDEWFELLAKTDVPVGKVLGVDEVFSGPQAKERGMVLETEHFRYGRVRQIGFPIRFSDTPWRIRIGPAQMGDHTNEVLAGLGYPADEIERLRQEGVIY